MDNRKKVLVLVDGHNSHEAGVVLEYCLGVGFEVVRSPAHCTHVVQVLDSHQLFGAFQTLLRHNIQRMCRDGDIVTMQNFGAAFTPAWNRVFGDSDRIKGVFESYGQYPFNPARLDTSKIKSQVMLVTVSTAAELEAAGMEPELAASVARQHATCPLFRYKDSYKQQILDDMCRDMQDEGVSPEVLSRQRLVSEAFLALKRRAPVKPSSAGGRTKRRRKSMGNQAAVLTAAEHMARRRREEQHQHDKQKEDAKRAAYNKRRQVQCDDVDKENIRRAAVKKEASEQVKLCK